MKTGLDAAEEYAAPADPGTGQALPFSMESAPGAETVINGRRCLYFGGTGYFGLHGNAEMMKAGIEAFQWGTHSATTRAGFGNNPVLLDVEKKLADFFGAEEAVYFVSGYFNALFLAQALAADYDAAFIDETSHFSVRDGVRTTGKPVFAYKHRDPADLRARLETVLKAGQRPLVMTDGVFPTFGEIAPVPDLIECLKPYDGILALDDAHDSTTPARSARPSAATEGSCLLRPRWSSGCARRSAPMPVPAPRPRPSPRPRPRDWTWSRPIPNGGAGCAKTPPG